MDIDTTMYTEPSPVAIVFGIIVTVWAVVVLWRVFRKAGQPGWAAIIPIYNLVVLCRVAGMSGWFVILLLVPFVNIIVAVFVALGVARNFRKSGAFAIVALWLFSLIGYTVLAFDTSEYHPIDPQLTAYAE
jgi:hypothetical protein